MLTCNIFSVRKGVGSNASPTLDSGGRGCEDELHDDVGVDGLVFVLAIFIPPTVRDSSLCRAMLLHLPLQCMTACVLKLRWAQERGLKEISLPTSQAVK